MHYHRLNGVFAALMLGLALSGCTSITSITAGTAFSQVQAQFGPPDYSCPLPNGGTRVLWSGQPYRQASWGANIDSQGRISQPPEQLLTDKHFSVLSQGDWTPEQVLCEFGPPAQKEGVGLPSVRQIVWSYAYKQDGVWDSLMYVYFGHDGKKVTRFHPGPDPDYEPGRFMPFLSVPANMIQG